MKSVKSRARVLFAVVALSAIGATTSVAASSSSHSTPSACRCLIANKEA